MMALSSHTILKLCTLTLCIGMVFACQIVTSDSKELNNTLSKKEIAEQWKNMNNCGSCHLSAPKSGEHQMHLFEQGTADYKYNPNGIITCADCHALSIQTNTSENPDMLFDKEAIIPDIRHLDDVTDFADVKAYLAKHFNDETTPSFKTTLYHKNGVIDISFAETNLERDDTNKRTPASYNFKTRTCATTYCHGEEQW